ncbi:MAG: hypothetical protein ABL963_14445 [Longimicrobiales bacterium]
MMLATLRMLSDSGPIARETIEALVRLRTAEYRTQGLGPVAARFKGIKEVLGDVRRVYERGGSEEVHNFFGPAS